MLFTCIKSWFFRNHLANFHQISHWSFCWNVIDCLFKWSCSIDCQAHIFFFKTYNCSNDDIFISCDDRIGKMLHNICMSAVAMSLRWANRGPWAYCLKPRPKIAFFAVQNASSEYSGLHQRTCSTVQSTLNSSNINGLFTMVNSNSFLSPNSSRKQIFGEFYHNICILCVLIRIASLRQF